MMARRGPHWYGVGMLLPQFPQRHDRFGTGWLQNRHRGRAEGLSGTGTGTRFS